MSVELGAIATETTVGAAKADLSKATQTFDEPILVQTKVVALTVANFPTVTHFPPAEGPAKTCDSVTTNRHNTNSKTVNFFFIFTTPPVTSVELLRALHPSLLW